VLIYGVHNRSCVAQHPHTNVIHDRALSLGEADKLPFLTLYYIGQVKRAGAPKSPVHPAAFGVYIIDAGVEAAQLKGKRRRVCNSV
jgi:hypothetical protein